MSTQLSPGQVDSDAKIRNQLARILDSDAFRNVDRLRGFLQFIIEEALAGRADRLKEYSVGVEVFGKPGSFDPRNDPIVRVQARRLRARLTSYYLDEGKADEIIIELPKGGYAPAFVERPASVVHGRSLTAMLVSHNTVVVVPFEDHSPGGELEFVCRGMSQELIHALSKIDTIRVVAWDLPLSLGSSTTSREAADRLHAATVISGSIRGAEEDLRITAHIVDAVSGTYLWSEAFDRKKSDVIQTQKDVASAVVEQFKSDQPIVRGKSSHRAHENVAAYNLTLRGRHHLDRRTESSLFKAVDLFERALAEDADFASAHAGLADAYGLLTHYGVIPPQEAWTKAASYAASAVLLDDALAESHTTLAHVKSTQDWDWKGAEHEFQRAIKLDPQYSTARHWYALSCLAPLGRLDEALEQIHLAQALDPTSSIISRDVSMVYFYRRECDAALAQHDLTIDLDPHFALSYWTIGLVYRQCGDMEKAIESFEHALQLSPESPRMHAALARSFALAGRRRKATRILEDLHNMAAERYVSPFEFACIYFGLDDSDAGFEWLSKACDDRCFDVINLKIDPRFDSIRDDPRMTATIDRIGLGGEPSSKA